MTDIAGFWSYVREDDDNAGKAISKLAKRVMAEFALLSAESLELFIDRDLRWGDEWKRRIDEALQQTTFFIPIITPRYFRSKECRRELVEFKSAAEEFGVKQLLLPIYFVSVPEMEEEEPSDELMALVNSIHRVDMRDLRLADEAGSAYLKLVNSLAARILEIAIETEGQLSPEIAAPESTEVEVAVADPGDDGSEAGFLEVLAAGEEAIPAWGEAAEKLGGELQKIDEAAQRATAVIEEEDNSGTATFKSRLASANRFAKELDGPAENLTIIGQDFAAQLIQVDPMIQTLIRLSREYDEARESEETKEFFSTVRETTNISRESMAQLEDLANTMEDSSGMSRELRRPLRKIQTALRNISDGQKVLDDWAVQINELMPDDSAGAGPATE